MIGGLMVFCVALKFLQWLNQFLLQALCGTNQQVGSVQPLKAHCKERWKAAGTLGFAFQNPRKMKNYIYSYIPQKVL